MTWGLALPRVFKPGDDFYVWDVEVPYYDMRGVVRFSPAWKIVYARWNRPSPGIPAPTIEGNQVAWRVKLPEVGTRLHLRLGLERLPL